MSKVEHKIRQRKIKRSQQPNFVPITPVEVTEKVKIVELDLISNAYFNPDVEEQNFNIGEDEIQFMIDSLTEQRNDYATKAAAYQARARLLHAAVVERNKIMKMQSDRIGQLEAELKLLKTPETVEKPPLVFTED